MTPENRLEQLRTLNELGEILNREPEFAAALAPALARLVNLLGLSTGWVFMSTLTTGDAHQGGFRLVAHSDLPPALSVNNRGENDLAPLCWEGCECQSMFRRRELDAGVNMVTCSRLKGAGGDTRGLKVHASIPLLGRAGPVGIINLAAPDNERFTEERLAFLTAVGRQLGTAFERSRLQEARTQEARYAAMLEERQRLAQTMHDSVTQLLFAADLSLSVALELEDGEPKLENGQPPEEVRRRNLEAAHDAVRGALAELQGIVEVMRPADVSQGLKVALTRLAQRVAGSVSVQLEAENLPLPPLFEDELYRVAQEAVHNALRHAEARNLWLELRGTPEGVVLNIRDDGKGFGSAPSGPGLEGMRERVATLHGNLVLKEVEPSGSLVRVEVPWPPNS